MTPPPSRFGTFFKNSSVLEEVGIPNVVVKNNSAVQGKRQLSEKTPCFSPNRRRPITASLLFLSLPDFLFFSETISYLSIRNGISPSLFVKIYWNHEMTFMKDTYLSGRNCKNRKECLFLFERCGQLEELL